MVDEEQIGGRILVIEDDEWVARLLAVGIREAGHRVTLCSEGADGIAAIGSGGAYATAAARALVAHSTLGAADIVQASLKIAGDLCIYTNQNIEIEVIE